MSPALLACLFVLATPVPPEPRLDEIKSFLKNFEGFGFSGTVLLEKGAKEIFAGTYGLADREHGYRNQRDTIYDIASMSKSFTAVAALQLVERGKLSLDDPLSRFLSGVPADKQAITVRQLISHTAGLDSDFPFKEVNASDYEVVDKEDALRRILEVPLLQEPGKGYSYSNIGFTLLAAVIEEAAGKPFRDVIREQIIGPAGLMQTGFWGVEVPRAPADRFAKSYEGARMTADFLLRSSTTWCDLGGGQMVSTAPDILKFFNALRGGKLLSRQMLDLAWTAIDGNYGMGFWIYSKPRPEIRTAGNNLGYGSILKFYPEEDLVLVMVGNSVQSIIGTNHVVGAIIPQIWFGADYRRVFSNEAFTMPPANKPLSRRQESAVIGKYSLGSSTLTIGHGEQGLEIGATGQEGVNVLLNSDSKEAAMLAGLSEKIVFALSELTQGRSAALKAAMRNDDVELFQGYSGAFTRLLRGWDDEKLGRFHFVKSLGTAPAGFPRGTYDTTLLFGFDKGQRRIRVGWTGDGKILNIGTAAKGDLYSVRLRAGSDGSLVGWSLTTYRSFYATPVPGGLRFNFAGKQLVARRTRSE